MNAKKAALTPATKKSYGMLPINASPQQSLTAYLRAIRQVDMLTPEKEQELAHKLYEKQDLMAARSLVISNLRFVVYIARSYEGYGLPLADLIQEGNIGLMRAVKRFDPNRKVRLITFAVYWIRAEIHEYILKNWSLVKIATTKAQRKLFFNLRSHKKRLAWMTDDEAKAIAKDLGVTPEETRAMEARLTGGDVSLDATIEDEEGDSSTLLNYLPDDIDNPEQRTMIDDRKERLHLALARGIGLLDERSRDIIKQRWLLPQKTSLQELATKYDISAERVRQIEKKAFGQVRQQLADFNPAE